MGKFIVRITVIVTAIYFVIAFLLAQLFGIDILYRNYSILFELCVVIYCFSEGKYHCKYIKYTALAILVCDMITHLDNRFDIMSASMHNIFPIIILAIGITIGIVKSIHHFILVRKLKRRFNGAVVKN